METPREKFNKGIKKAVKEFKEKCEKNRNPRIYIAGKITGENQIETIGKFSLAAKEVKAAGFEPVNPLDVVGTWDIAWEDAMKLAIKAMLGCDAVYHLPCAKFSNGAQIELQLARYLCIPTANDIQSLKRLFDGKK